MDTQFNKAFESLKLSNQDEFKKLLQEVITMRQNIDYIRQEQEKQGQILYNGLQQNISLVATKTAATNALIEKMCSSSQQIFDINLQKQPQFAIKPKTVKQEQSDDEQEQSDDEVENDDEEVKSVASDQIDEDKPKVAKKAPKKKTAEEKPKKEPKAKTTTKKTSKKNEEEKKSDGLPEDFALSSTKSVFECICKKKKDPMQEYLPPNYDKEKYKWEAENIKNESEGGIKFPQKVSPTFAKKLVNFIRENGDKFNILHYMLIEYEKSQKKQA